MKNNALKNYFDQVVNPFEIEGRTLNYVWLDDLSSDYRLDRGYQRPQDSLCSLPLHYFDKAVQNARSYPETNVYVWLDFSKTDALTKFFVSTAQYYSDVPNLKICDLGSIKDYNRNRAFFDDSSASIWSRVDLARLLAVKYCFENTYASDVFYSDFDVDNTMLNSTHVAQVLKEYNMVFGATKSGRLENGYMGFRGDEGKKFLIDSLLPETARQVKEGKTGYPAFLEQLQCWAKTKDIKNWLTALGMNILFECKYEIPTDIRYANIC